MKKPYKYIGYWFILLLPLTILAFYKPYFQYFPNFGTIKNTIHIHAFIASVWILILVLQPILIRKGKYVAHKLIGRITYVWFPLLIGSFIPLMINILNSDFPKAIFYSSADITLLILFYALAIYHKKKMNLHMRYMILTAIVFLGPTVGRIGGLWLGLPPLISQGIQYLLIAVILTALIIRDRSDKNARKPFLTGAVGYLIHAGVFYAIFH